jgi:uncharacterized protein (DUF3084 family)
MKGEERTKSKSGGNIETEAKTVERIRKLRDKISTFMKKELITLEEKEKRVKSEMTELSEKRQKINEKMDFMNEEKQWLKIELNIKENELNTKECKLDTKKIN